jgi:O-antigen biosynthesis protein WbqP
MAQAATAATAPAARQSSAIIVISTANRPRPVAAPIPILLSVLAILTVTTRGKPFFGQQRVGLCGRRFRMYKFRTMRLDTPQLATHLLLDWQRWTTPLGNWLRKASLDELPQLWSILRGQMSFVGPRPALFNQDDLVRLRTAVGVHTLVPGLTGWAQINGRDELSIPDKVELDEHYFAKRSVAFDFHILLQTIVKVCRRDGVRQAKQQVETEVLVDRRAA